MASRMRAFGPPLFVVALLAGVIPAYVAGCGEGPCILSPAGLAGLLLGIAGVLLCLRAATLFLRYGEAPLHPFAAPRRLLLQGPYGRIRNPFYAGILMMVAGEALLWRSWALVAYGAGLAVALHLFVRLVEEPRMRRLFGDAYDLYRARVPRWLPRRRA